MVASGSDKELVIVLEERGEKGAGATRSINQAPRLEIPHWAQIDVGIRASDVAFGEGHTTLRISRYPNDARPKGLEGYFSADSLLISVVGKRRQRTITKYETIADQNSRRRTELIDEPRAPDQTSSCKSSITAFISIN